jgi:hypothetical protein
MKGKCINDYCLEFNKVVEIPDGEDFVCKCGHHLYEVTEKVGGFGQWIKEYKLLVIIAAAVLVACIVLFFVLGGDSPEDVIVVPPEKIIVE